MSSLREMPASRASASSSQRSTSGREMLILATMSASGGTMRSYSMVLPEHDADYSSLMSSMTKSPASAMLSGLTSAATSVDQCQFGRRPLMSKAMTLMALKPRASAAVASVDSPRYSRPL